MTGPLRRLAAPLALVLARPRRAGCRRRRRRSAPAAEARRAAAGGGDDAARAGAARGDHRGRGDGGGVVLEGAGRGARGGDRLRRLHAAGGRSGDAAGDLRGQRRAGGGVGLPQHRGDRAVAAADGPEWAGAVAGRRRWCRTPRPGSPFTDLVFVDPVGTGFSRLIEPDDAKRGRYLAIEGDVAALAQVVRRWLVENGRVRRRATSSARATAASAGRWSPRRCARTRGWRSTGWCWSRRCSTSAGGRQAEHTPWPAVALLPSLAAAEMEAEGRFSEAGPGGGGGLCGGRLRDRPAARRRRRGGGRADRRAGDGADRARPGGGGGDRRTGRRRGLRARGRPRRGAADERLRRRGARGRAAAGAAARRRPGARRDDRAADRGDAGALPRHAAAGCRTGATSS